MKGDLVVNYKLDLLRTATLVVLVVGAIVSLGLTLYTGRKNESTLLIALFLIWVISPFIALIIANLNSKGWTFFTRLMLYILMLFITIGSVIGYSGKLNPPGTKPGFIFLFVPFLSWTIMTITFLIVRFKKSN